MKATWLLTRNQYGTRPGRIIALGLLALGLTAAGCSRIDRPRESDELDRIARAVENTREYEASRQRRKERTEQGRSEGGQQDASEAYILSVESYRPLRDAARDLYLRRLGAGASEAAVQEAFRSAHRLAFQEVEQRFFRRQGDQEIPEDVRAQYLSTLGESEEDFDQDLREALQMMDAEGSEGRPRIQAMFRRFFSSFVRGLDPWGGLLISVRGRGGVVRWPYTYRPLDGRFELGSAGRLGLDGNDQARPVYELTLKDWNGESGAMARVVSILDRLSAGTLRRETPLLLDLRGAVGTNLELVDTLIGSLDSGNWLDSPIVVWLDDLTRGAPEAFVRRLAERPNVLLVGGNTTGYAFELCESEFPISASGRPARVYMGCEPLAGEDQGPVRVHLALPWSRETAIERQALASSVRGELLPQSEDELSQAREEERVVADEALRSRIEAVRARVSVDAFTENAHVAAVAREWASVLMTQH